MTSSPRLESQIALVTGAASGIGEAVAGRFADEGATVFLADNRESLLDRAVAQIESKGRKAIPVICDVTIESAVKSMTNSVIERVGKIDILVACAGITSAGLVHETSLKDWNLIIATNLTGAFLSMQSVIPAMLSQGKGSIITVGSISANLVGAGGGSAAYEASKAALVQLTRAVAYEYATAGIKANCISPGKIATRLGQHEMEMAQNTYTSRRTAYRPSFKKRMIESGTSDEIAALAAFIASSESPFMTGANIVVDGGYSLF